MTLYAPNPMSVIVGLDLSLTGTGVVVLDDGSITAKKLIKTKPSGNDPKAETERLLTIKEQIKEVIEQVKPKLVLIEGLAFSARNSTALVQLSGLNYLVREYLVLSKIPFVIVAPTTLKKFIMGKGAGPKELMLLETYKRYGISFLDNNLCDAFGLTQCGLALRGESKKPLQVHEKEVVKLLSSQYQVT